MHKVDIKNLTLEDLKKTVAREGEPAYRAQQVFSWVYKKNAPDFNAISNIPSALKDKLEEKFYISGLAASGHFKSKDNTEKALLSLEDGNAVETVLIPAKDRVTLCLSTQIGCKFACPFCASGKGGFKRNLTAAEILNQILYFLYEKKRAITNYVFMGMGEPLDNCVNLEKVVRIMTDPAGLAVGARRITISTCGIVPGIKKLSGMGLQVNLSVSLHATNNGLRDKIVPANKRYPIESLIAACAEFREKTKRMITLEYVLLRGVNNSARDAEGLAAIAKRLKAKVNVIPYSEVPGFNYKTPSHSDTVSFMKNLVSKKIPVTLRESKGKDIQAACGQLRGRFTIA